MGTPTLFVFSFPSHEQEHGRFTTGKQGGPPLPLRATVEKLTEEIKGEHPDWTDGEVKAELRKRLRRPREET